VQRGPAPGDLTQGDSPKGALAGATQPEPCVTVKEVKVTEGPSSTTDSRIPDAGFDISRCAQGPPRERISRNEGSTHPGEFESAALDGRHVRAAKVPVPRARYARDREMGGGDQLR